MSGSTEQGGHQLTDFPLCLVGHGSEHYCGKSENCMFVTSWQFCNRQSESEMHRYFVLGSPGNVSFYGGACITSLLWHSEFGAES